MTKAKDRSSAMPGAASIPGHSSGGTSVNPLQSGKARLLCAALVFVAAFALYLRTLAPTVTLTDSGELIVAARTLGVAHPPGFPLYVLLAHAATWLPVGNIAVRTHMASALFAALASSMATMAMAEALLLAGNLVARRDARKKKAERKRQRKHDEKRSQAPAGTESDLAANSGGAPRESLRWAIALAPVILAGLLLAFSRTLWAYATIAEVYTLNTLLILIIFFLLLRWRRNKIGAASAPHQETTATGLSAHLQAGDRLVYAAAFTFGLALGVHHVTVALTLPALAAVVYGTEGVKFFKSKRLGYAALFAFAGLFLIYAYLPLSAARGPVMNWGNPRTLGRVWAHVTGSQYQAALAFSPDRIGQQLEIFLKFLTREFGPTWLPVVLALAACGLIALWRRDRTLFFFLTLIALGNLAYTLNYQIADDKDAYHLPVFVATALAAGFGAAWLLQWLQQRIPQWIGAKRALVAPALASALAALSLTPVAALAGNWAEDNRHDYFFAHDYAENILSTIAPRGMLLTRDWQVSSPLLYVREVEQRRRDVIELDLALMERTWYFDYLARQYPDLLSRSRAQVDAYLEDLKSYERDPSPYQRDAALASRLKSRFREMILTFVNDHLRSAPVYVTLQDIAAGMDKRDKELTQAINNTYQMVPQGLVLQLFADRDFHDPAEPQLTLRGLNRTGEAADAQVAEARVRLAYLNTILERGRYLAAAGRHERAIRAYQQALSLDPTFPPARRLLAESQNAMRQAPPGVPQ